MSTEAKRGKWYSPWCTYFQSLLDERHLNPSDFAAISGNRQNNIWRYLNGDVRPPRKDLSLWCHRLHLDESERAKFIRLGELAWAPAEVRAEISHLRDTIATLRTEQAAIRRLLKERGVELPGLIQ